jgi:lauroyl/myristoyl acyltransferase
MRSIVRPFIADLSAGLAGLAYHAGAGLASGLPAPLARRAGRWLGLMCWALQRQRRRALRENLRRLAPGEHAARAGECGRRAFANFGESVVDTLRLAHAGPAEPGRRVRIEGAERLERAAAGGGAVLLAAHAGNWEWAGAALAARGLRVGAAARAHAPGTQNFFDALRGRFGVVASPSLRELLTAPRPCLVGVFCDRPGSGHHAKSPERVARSALAVAARRGWAAFPAVVLRDGQGYRVVLGPELAPAHTRQERERAARVAVTFLAGHLHRHLDQWFAFDPAGALS